MSQARFWSFCWAPLFQPPTCPTSSSLCLCRVCFPFVGTELSLIQSNKNEHRIISE
ncbi:hypothetical protein ACJIZ3_017894 [Penstemon smallii]|uniref:Uncharacterized protein n=1 Tax=Penstemon smallii TaxID=265156 RepID=A0ABD3SWW8_9LAMI